jgi:hypothetical protein
MRHHPDYENSDLRTKLASIICDPGFRGHFWVGVDGETKWRNQQIADRVLATFDVKEKRAAAAEIGFAAGKQD